MANNHTKIPTACQRWFVFDYDDRGWTEVDEDYDGDGDNILVEVTEDRGVITLDCTQYYCREGILRLTITQPLERALATFAALLQADTRLEVEDGR